MKEQNDELVEEESHLYALTFYGIHEIYCLWNGYVNLGGIFKTLAKKLSIFVHYFFVEVFLQSSNPKLGWMFGTQYLLMCSPMKR